jgi:hypothetical protein
MKHVDHHTLELYVLKSASIQRKRRSVANHLAACPDCRAIADEILLIYTEAEKHIRPINDVPAVSQVAVREWNRHSLASREYDSRPLERVNRSLVRRFVRFSRSHPVVASTGLVATIVFLVIGTMNVMRWIAPASNPSQVHYDISRDLWEVYDKNENLLWQKPGRGLRDIQKSESDNGARYTMIGDLDGQGRNDVISMLPFESNNAQMLNNTIRIYDSHGQLIVSKSLGADVSYAGRIYPGAQFGGGGLALVHNPSETGMDIVASAPHYRSPSVIARMNGRGELLGEYWHFGHLLRPRTVPSAAGSGEFVILMGSNDADSNGGGHFPIIAVLDPSKITGRSEATATRGFGLPASSAEVAYIRIPRSDIDDGLHSAISVIRVMPGNDRRWSFIVEGMNDTTIISGFEYVFDASWRIEAVLSVDGNARIRAGLLEKGLVHGQIDQQYLDALKNSVEYWDGHRWMREFSLVHPAVARN